MRKITFVSNNTTEKKVIMSEAVTLKELKEEMVKEGMDVNNKAFYEGFSRTELVDDNSILPTNVPYKGDVVNDLVIHVTTAQKNIKSGAPTRSQMYDVIKASKDLQDSIKRAFGMSYTNVSTENLYSFLDNYFQADDQDNDQDDDVTVCISEVERAALTMIRLVVMAGPSKDFMKMAKVMLCDDCDVKNSELKSPYSDQEIAELLKDRN